MNEPMVGEPQTRYDVPDRARPGVPTSEALPEPSLLRVLALQRKVVGVAVILMVACLWVIGAAGEWRIATLACIGILLALVNHLVGEYWLGKVIGSGAQPTRAGMAASAFVRLAVLTVVAVGAAVLTWPDGIGLLLGLAIFRLVALVMTMVPLLKELKAQ